ncbi:hypothetical protein BS78_04G289400 [Paspalum vaginatum]|nr:hypothetical protein BS78_04G289400 [Paspalum vaginatum]
MHGGCPSMPARRPRLLLSFSAVVPPARLSMAAGGACSGRIQAVAATSPPRAPPAPPPCRRLLVPDPGAVAATATPRLLLRPYHCRPPPWPPPARPLLTAPSPHRRLCHFSLKFFSS